MSTDPSARPGSARQRPATIGRYRILDRIGRGAMGVVYSARDDKMDREVALKMMMGALEAEPDVRARFKREAQLAAQLLHPNIVTIFDIGEDDGRLYIVMELLRGRTLNEYLEQPAADALESKLELITQVYEALALASGRGIYHRDIKPSNLFVADDGSLKILDFGLARLATSNMTVAGSIVGTPDYMSPEQARGADVDQRSDIFSAGAVFYWMLSGRKPFEAPDLPSVLWKVDSEDPPPLDPEQAPPALSRIVMTALAKDPGDRYQHADEVLEALAQFSRTYDSDTRKRGLTVRARCTLLESLSQQCRDAQAVLGLDPAARYDADLHHAWCERHPVLAQRGVDTLALAPFRRHEIDALLHEVETAVESAQAELDALRAEASAAYAQLGDDARLDTTVALADAEQALRAGDFDVAFREAEAVLASDPTDETALMIYWQCRAARRDALAQRRRAAQAVAHTARARGLLADKRFVRAEQEAERAAELDPTHRDVIAALAECRRQRAAAAPAQTSGRREVSTGALRNTAFFCVGVVAETLRKTSDRAAALVSRLQPPRP